MSKFDSKNNSLSPKETTTMRISTLKDLHSFLRWSDDFQLPTDIKGDSFSIPVIAGGVDLEISTKGNRFSYTVHSYEGGTKEVVANTASSKVEAHLDIINTITGTIFTVYR